MKKLNKKAFTLIELLVVIAVVGILVLLGAPKFMGHTQKAELIRIQHDARVMEEEMRTVLINGDDDFNEWENNMKDLNQLAQEDKLFEKEGFAEELDDSHLVANRTVDLRKHASQLEPSNKTKLNVGGELHEAPEELSISETYKVIPERYKAEINSKLKGTFYANSDGKVYYEHVKSLSRILTKNEKPEKIDDLIKEGVIPVADADELNNVRYERIETYGKGTKWEGKYLGGLDKQYIQVADINLSEYSAKEEGWEPIGASVNYTSSFRGTYDGGNYVIRNLKVKGEGKSKIHQGLFGRTYEATIRNVGLIDSEVKGYYNVGGLVGFAERTEISGSYATGSVTGSLESTGNIGGLVGSADKNTTISNSYATGDVTGTRSVGGLLGSADASTISNSYATGSVTSEGSGKNTVMAGGLVGYISGGTTISNSYATGDVTGTVTGGGTGGTGGLLGAFYKSSDPVTISNSYATGLVTAGKGTGKNEVGGLVGQVYKDNYKITISNAYWDINTTGQTSSYGGGGIGLATEQMKNQATYSGWDTNIWEITPGNYPTLR